MRRNYSYQRKKLLSLRDAVILHLEPFSSYANPYDMPEATCQEEMSRLLFASRGNLSRVMNELKKEGYLNDMRAHVPIGKLRRKTYVLTEVGMQEARSLRRKTGERKIRLKDENDEQFEVMLGEIPKDLRDGSSLLDIALSVRKGVFDKQAYLERIKRESEFVSIEEDMPRTRHFFGREDEREEILEWFESETEKILEVKGVAGIGKTALVATAFDELRKRTNAIWLKLTDQSTVRSILEQIAALLNLLGRKKLGTYLKSHKKIRNEEVLYIAIDEFKDMDLLFVLDGCEKIQSNLIAFVRFIARGLRGQRGAKAIFAGRSIPKLYDKNLYKRQGLSRRIVLRKLDYESSRKILQLKGVENWRQEEAYAQTGGVPFFLDLVDPTHEFITTDVEEYLEEEVLSELRRDEMRLLKIASTFYQPVHSDAFFMWKGMRQRTVNSLVDKSLLFEVSPMIYDTHDILRDSVSEKLGPQTRKNYHKKAAMFHLEQGDIESMVQASLHLIDAGQKNEAVGLLKEDGRQIIAKGHSEDLYNILHRLDPERRYPDEPELAFLRGECLSIRGSWDKAIGEYERYLTICEKMEDLAGVSTSLRRIAGLQRRRGNHKVALRRLEKSAKISDDIGDLEGLADTYYNMGAIFLKQDNLGRSQEYVEKCLETAEISGNMAEIAKAHQALGIIKERLGKQKEGLRTKRKAVDYAKESGDLHLLSNCYTDLGVSYYRLEKNEEAQKSYEKAVESARRIGDVRAVAFGLYNAASAYIEKPDLVKAEECLNEAVEIFEVVQEENMVASAYLSYGFIYNMRGKWGEAEEYFEKNLDLIENSGSLADLYESYRTIGQITLKRDRRKGLAYLKKASAVAERVKEVSLRNTFRSEIRDLLSKAARRE